MRAQWHDGYPGFFSQSLVAHAAVFALLALGARAIPDKAKSARSAPIELLVPTKKTAPAARSRAVAPQRPSKARAPAPKEPAPAAPQAIAAREAEAEPSARPVEAAPYARDAAAGQGSALSDYAGDVIALLERQKKYPGSARRRGQQGLVLLSITVGKGGELIDASVSEPSPFPDLNEAALALVRSIASFPALPPSVNLARITLRIPVAYKLE
jgi:protein TonB